jgi:hypothetical protein
LRAHLKLCTTNELRRLVCAPFLSFLFLSQLFGPYQLNRPLLFAAAARIGCYIAYKLLRPFLYDGLYSPTPDEASISSVLAELTAITDQLFPFVQEESAWHELLISILDHVCTCVFPTHTRIQVVSTVALA